MVNAMRSASVIISAELRELVARQRAERPELDNAPEIPVMPQMVGADRHPVRCKRRYKEWHSRAYAAAAELRRRHKDKAGEINAALVAEIERGPDFLEWRRGSEFKDPPRNNMDREYIHRVWWTAQMIERKSWACKKKGKHGGTLGTVALELLRTLLFVVKKQGGQLFPSYETLAVLTRKSKQAVITAMKVLEAIGFVTIHKRIKRIATPFGPRVVQDSNAYEFHPPKKGIGALAVAVFCRRPSESMKSDAMEDTYRKNSKDSGDEGSKDRWWLDPPLATGSGAWR
jgi:hypothetical protein